MSARPPSPLDEALRGELEALAHAVERSCAPYRASHRSVEHTEHLPLALRWFWEIFGYSALVQECVPPDDPAAREAALGMLREWCLRDLRYEELVARAEQDHEVIAFDETHIVFLSKARGRIDEDPPLVVVHEPSGASEAPDFEPYALSALRYMVRGVLKGLWSELVRVLLLVRPPIVAEQPFARLAPHVGTGRLSIDGSTVSLWLQEREVRDRPGFALYFSHEDAEAVEAWLVAEGFADQMLV